MSGRADPFAGSDDLDLSDFQKTPAARPKISPAAIREVSEANNFPSRAAPTPVPQKGPQRRRRTGRNQQLNLKVTAVSVERFTALADANGWGLGEAFEQAVSALENRLQQAQS